MPIDPQEIKSLEKRLNQKLETLGTRGASVGKKKTWTPPDPTTKPEPWVCSNCGAVNIPGWNGWEARWFLYRKCDQCKAKARQRADLQQQLEERKAAYLVRYGFADPDNVYSQMTFQHYKPLTDKQKAAKAAAVAVCNGWLQDKYSTGLIFYGTSYGVGKTHLAVAMTRFAVEHLQSVAIWEMPEYIKAIKKSYEAGGTDKIEASASEPAVLVLDDVGREYVKTAPWYQDLVCEILDIRWRRHRAVIVTTNLSPVAMEQWIGGRAQSRLMAICEQVIEIDGKDYRQRSKKAKGEG